MFKTKRASLMVIMFTCIGLICVGSVLAYLTGMSLPLDNMFLMADFRVNIHENGKLVPNTDVLELRDTSGNLSKPFEKVVTLKNAGEINAFSRVTLVPRLEHPELDMLDKDGRPLLTGRAGHMDYSKVDDSDDPHILYTWTDLSEREEPVYTYKLSLAPNWKDNWLLDKDNNVFYYRYVLPKGAETPPLLKSVLLSIPEGVPSYKYPEMYFSFHLEVLAESIQSYQAGDGTDSLVYSHWDQVVKRTTGAGGTLELALL